MAHVQLQAAAAQQHHFGGHFQAPQHPQQQQQQQQQQPQQPEVIRPHPTEMVKPVDKPSEDENKKPPGFNATPEPVENKDNNTNDQMPTIDDWSEDVAKDQEDNEMNRGRGGYRGRGRGNSNFRGRGGKNYLTPSPMPSLTDNDYRFSVGKLPVWAKKQLSVVSSPGAGPPGPSADPDLPKGRWAARNRDHVTVKTHYVSDSIITRPFPGIRI